MRSKFEENVADLFLRANVKFDYEATKVPYTIKAIYTPDFKIGDIYIETKGLFKPEDRRKMIAVKKDNPDLDIRMWFMRDNYLTKAKKSKYSDWAKKNGYKYHVGLTFPKKWFAKKKKDKK